MNNIHPGRVLLCFRFNIRFVQICVFLNVGEFIDFELMLGIERMVMHRREGHIGVIRRAEINEDVPKAMLLEVFSGEYSQRTLCLFPYCHPMVRIYHPALLGSLSWRTPWKFSRAVCPVLICQ